MEHLTSTSSSQQEPSPLLAAALDYASRGWLVIPLHTPDSNGGCSCGKAWCIEERIQGKHPRTPHGLKEGSADPAVIGKWWKRWPDANIGIDTGSPSGIFVLDKDPAHGGDVSLAALERQYGPLPDTWVVLSGGGGCHYYFLLPEGVKVPCSVGQIAPGIDIRGEGGYVVAPPSLHLSGHLYELAAAAIPPVASPTRWLDLILKPPARYKYGSHASADGFVHEGGHRNYLLQIVGSMAARGMCHEAIEVAALTENAMRLRPPYPNEDLRELVRDIFAKEQKKRTKPNGHA